MTVVDWSDSHKIAALRSENATLKLRATERETLIANQERTIAALYTATVGLLKANDDEALHDAEHDHRRAALKRHCEATAHAWSVLAHCNGSTPPQQQGGST